ncbi:family 43 glycosylhydrolase [Streptomyces radiopugnans]|uniref:Arabinan endo-1,5-alpha-L-arabinosidase n=1 Tax=Streptomyces radiopugnans TaxID=403935 RepID=A0A1H9BPR4_9ACTN|nr:family 43 glycosylhydrolase [Streptomyces radiopugnans]SEP90767.1 arabinan endo-1,5-alpha-L-arabinosidase [Streptomyces radiopugnans]
MGTVRRPGPRARRTLAALAIAALTAGGAQAPGAAAEPGQGADRDGRQGAGTYVNPVSRGFADTFADPAVVRGEDGHWYAFGTTDPLRSGEGRMHSIPIARSADLVDWTYVGDALGGDAPAFADTGAAYWAPDITRHDGRYWLYFTVTETTVTGERGDSAIGVATAPTPAGPWTVHDEPVVAPRPADGGSGFKWTFDPAHVVDTDGRRHLYYGSYHGGIWVTELSADGTRAVGEPAMVATDNRFEGAYAVRRGGWWYLFASSGDCCAGPTTGYSAFAGRSRSVRGPFTDREGVPLTASRTGGTVVLTPNGNRWVGTGHNSVVTDLAGQDWMVYHAIDRERPYLDEPYGVNRRPMLIDRLDWEDGWPVVRGGLGASERRQKAPVTDPRHARAADRERDGGHRDRQGHRPGRLDPARGDEFEGDRLGPGWSWVRPADVRLDGGRLVWPTQDADLHKGSNTASVLLREAPRGDYTVETRLTIDLGEDTVRNYQQAGLVAYTDDDRYLRLSHVAIWNTRQTEFGKERPYAGRVAYGSMTVGPPARTTWLRLRHTTDPRTGEHRFRAYTSRDGARWIAGGTWTMPADAKVRIGLVSHGGSGATAEFHHFRVHRG